MIEKDSSRFKIYDANSGEQTCEVEAHRCPILASEYIKSEKLICTSSDDLTLKFWDCSTFNLK